MRFIDLFNYRELNLTAAKPAIAAGLLAAALMASLGTAALLAVRKISAKAFWWAFWGGMGSRLAVLASFMFFCLRFPAVCAPALLISYAVGVFLLLPLELGLALRR